jgi:beta-galactosidase
LLNFCATHLLYIYAQGGLPYWLLRENPSIGLRKNDPTFLAYVNRWFSKLLPMMVPLLYKNGGPIIMIQIENEYGSTNDCDEDYKAAIRDMIKDRVQDNVVLFTVDGHFDKLIKCGRVDDPKVLTTIDFGTETDPSQAFRTLRKYQKTGPLVNSEFYTGWLDHWAHPHQTVSADVFAYSLERLLRLNASVNM